VAELGLLAPGSDRDTDVRAVACGSGFVVEPDPALGKVTEAQHGAARDGHRGAAGAVGPPPQWMCEGVPVVEITHDRHSPARLIGGQSEGDADRAVTPGPGCLDQLLSPFRRAARSGRVFLIVGLAAQIAREQARRVGAAVRAGPVSSARSRK